MLTDGRFSGGTTGLCIGHVAPEAANGGPIGLVQDGEAAWVPWPQLALLVVGVPLLAAAITWLVVPGRLPVRQADRD